MINQHCICACKSPCGMRRCAFYFSIYVVRHEPCGAGHPSAPMKAMPPSQRPLGSHFPPLLEPLNDNSLISTWRKSGGPSRYLITAGIYVTCCCHHGRESCDVYNATRTEALMCGFHFRGGDLWYVICSHVPAVSKLSVVVLCFLLCFAGRKGSC